MIKLVKKIIYAVLSLFCPPKTIFLMYHSVGNNEEFFTVQPDMFEKQMQYLKDKNIKVVSVWEALEKPFSPERRIILTFDDGYKNNYNNAFPIIKKYGFPAIIFISAGLIGKTMKAKKGAILPVLSVQEIKEMDQTGLIEFGSHCFSHRNLNTLSPEEIEKELVSSKNFLSGIINKSVDYIAYPWGVVDKRSMEMIKRHYKAGFGVKKGPFRGNIDRFLINRNSIDSSVSFSEFKGIVKMGRI